MELEIDTFNSSEFSEDSSTELINILNALCYFRQIKYFPLALYATLKQFDLYLDLSVENNDFKSLPEYTPWELVNFGVSQCKEIVNLVNQRLSAELSAEDKRNFLEQLDKNRIENMGNASFFAEHWQIQQPMIIVPSFRRGIWEKAVKILGFGASQLISIDCDQYDEFDKREFQSTLTCLVGKRIPLLGVAAYPKNDVKISNSALETLIMQRNYWKEENLAFYLFVNNASCENRKDTKIIEFPSSIFKEIDYRSRAFSLN